MSYLRTVHQITFIGKFGVQKFEAETFGELYVKMTNTATWYIKRARLAMIEGRNVTMHKAYLDAAQEIVDIRDTEVKPFLLSDC